MRTSDMVKSKYWRAADLKGKPPMRLTIADVTEELVGRGGRQETKCFLWFQEHLKGLQLNRTRVAVLELAFGPDSELWTGKRVRLVFDPTVIFGGQAVGGVKLETPPGVLFTPSADTIENWGTASNGHSRPPQPIWDEKRQTWITPQAPPPKTAPATSTRPPPPVWNEATQAWETVHPGTGEIRAPTISERVNAAHPAPQEDFNDEIPF